jgi:hypothetical protein
MATKPPNHQKLIVTGKNKKAADYGTDMRTIEQWANEGIVRSLHAGTNITLDPTDGVDTGTGITISASGGGSSTSVSFVEMTAGPDDFVDHSTAIWFGQGGGYSGLSDLQSFIPIFSSATDNIWIAFSAGWMAPPGPTYSACVLPEFAVPAFTGGPLTIFLTMNAATAIYSDFAIYSTDATPVSYTTGEDYQFQPSDFDYNSVHPASNLTMTAGSGPSQNGLVLTNAGIYFGGVTGQIYVPAGTTFT